MKRSANGLEKNVREAGGAWRQPVPAGESHAPGAGELASDGGGSAVVCSAGECHGGGPVSHLRSGSSQGLGRCPGEEILDPGLTLRETATGSCVPAPGGPLMPHQLVLGHQGHPGGSDTRADGSIRTTAPGGYILPPLLTGPAGNQRQQGEGLTVLTPYAGIVRPGTAAAGACVDGQAIASPTADARHSCERPTEVRTGASVAGSQIRQTCPAGMTLELAPCGPSQGSRDLVSTPHAGVLPAGELRPCTPVHGTSSVDELPDLDSTEGSSEGSEDGRQPASVMPGGEPAPSAPAESETPPPSPTQEEPQPQEHRVPQWMRQRLVVRRTIPRSAWKAWGACFADACSAVLSALDGTAAQLDSAAQHLLLLPARMLGHARGGPRATRGIVSRCEGSSDPLTVGQLGQPASHSAAPAPDNARAPSDSRRVDRVLQFLRAGRLTMAADAVDARPPARATPAVVAQLRELHPRAPVPDAVPAPAQPAVIKQLVDPGLLAAVVKALPRLSGAGPSGMCFEHIKAAVCGNERAAEALRQLVNAALMGRLTGRASTLLASRLVALPKPGGGVRPLAVGEVLCRMISMCAVRLATKVPAALAPTQLGVGVPGAIETILATVRSAVRQHPDWLVVTLDWRNAFNSVCRHAVLKSVNHVQPDLAGWAGTLLGEHSALITDSGALLSSQQGVRQGDPFSPMAFDLAIQPVLNAATVAVKAVGGLVRAFHDDVTIVAPAAAAKAAVRQIQMRGKQIGLQLRPNKCKVTSVSASAVAQEFATEHGFCYSADGLQLLGAAVGKDEFLASACRPAVDAVAEWTDHVMALPAPAQAKMLLVRDSGGAKLAHLPRWLPPAVATALCHPAAKHMLAAMAKLAGSEHLSATASAQAALPARMGGLGLRMWSRHDCEVAYTAGAGAAARVLRKYGCTQWLPLAEPTPDPALKHAMESLTARGLQGVHTHQVPPRWQSKLMQELHDLRLKQLLADVSPAARERIRAAGMPGASAWMKAMPVGALALSDMELQLGLKLWLGLHIQAPVPDGQAPQGCCLHEHHHPLTCPLLDDARRQVVMRDALSTVLQVAGVAVRPVTLTGQPVSPSHPGASQPTSSPAPPAPAVPQPEVSEPQSESCSTSAPVVHALETGLDGTARFVVPWLGLPKRKHQAPRLATARIAPFNWFGAPRKQAKQLLRLGRKAAAVADIPAWAYDAFARQCLSVAAIKANAQALVRHVAAARSLPQHSDAWSSEIAADLVLQAAAVPTPAHVSAVPGAPEE